MIYLRHVVGKHYEQLNGPWWALLIYRLMGWRLWNIKTKKVYKGTKA